MLFSSPTFFVFFVVYFTIYFFLPKQYRIYLIIAGSTVFYAWWRLGYIWVPYLLMATAYLGAKWLDLATEAAARKRRTAITIAALFLPLIFFKYTDFLYHEIFGRVFGLHGKLLGLPLPLGISFVTFTLTAYVVDIYRGRFGSRNSVATVLGYVLFFPHLIAGPILRPIELLPQIEHPRAASLRNFKAALAIFSLGLVKKLVFADQLAEVVDHIYAVSGTPSPTEALLAIYGFSVQIYCDFSGYTDMAIGLAMMLGVRLPNNFLQPYTAESIVDFWRRWHITLSYWLRDYLYIPLGGSRHGRLNEMRNIFITMALGGLWHGANWTFVVWGVLHGAAVAIVHLVRELVPPRFGRVLPRWFGVVCTFHFVTVAWVFFRARSIDKAGAMLAALFNSGWSAAPQVISTNLFPVLLILFMLGLHRFDDHRRIRAAVRRSRPELVWGAIALGWLLAIAVSQGSSAEFIYFDF